MEQDAPLSDSLDRRARCWSDGSSAPMANTDMATSSSRPLGGNNRLGAGVRVLDVYSTRIAHVCALGEVFPRFMTFQRRVRTEKTVYVTVYVMRALLCSERLHLTYVRRLKSLAKLRERSRTRSECRADCEDRWNDVMGWRGLADCEASGKVEGGASNFEGRSIWIL
jgi:hypothetical protein